MLVVDGLGPPEVDVTAMLDPGREVRRTTTIAEARECCGVCGPTAVLLVRELVEAPTRVFVSDLRGGMYGPPGVPIVAVTDDPALADDLGIDETVPPSVGAAALRDAIDRACLLGEYKNAIGDFFDACRSHAEERRSRDGSGVRSARDRADDCLEVLRAREHVVPLDRLIERS